MTGTKEQCDFQESIITGYTNKQNETSSKKSKTAAPKVVIEMNNKIQEENKIKLLESEIQT